MSNNDFLENDTPGQDFSSALESYMEACNQGNEGELLLSEDEYIYIIEHFIDQQDEKEALKASRLAFSRHPYSLELLIKFADSLIVAGDPDAAIELLDTYKDSYCFNPDMIYLYCRAYIHKGCFDLARRYYSDIQSVDNEKDNVGDATLALAQDCIDAANYQEALFYLTKVQETAPELFECFNDMAYCHEKLDNLNLAIDFYNKYLDKDPFNDNVWFNLGTIYAKMGNFEKAVEAFEYSLALNGKNSSSLYNMAVVYLNIEQYKKSVEFFDDFLECEPDSIAGYIGKANALMGLADYAAARDLFEQAHAMDPSCSEVNIGLEALSAIIHYLDGDKFSFYLRLDAVCAEDKTWIDTIVKLLPELSADMEFQNYVKMLGYSNIRPDNNTTL